MTTDIRSRLVARMHGVLDQKTKNLPNSIPISIDVGPLADAVIDEMTNGSGIPLLPRYDPDVWAKRRWTQPFIQEEVMEGAPVSTVGVDAGDWADEGAAGQITFTASVSGEQRVGEIRVSLPVDSAEEFLIAGLAAVAEARRRARIDAPDERG